MENAYGGIEEMMTSYADRAVIAAARDHGERLDFGEASLERLESILSRLEPAPGHAPSPAWLEEQSRLWGAYLGEVVRRRWGGTWSLDAHPNTPAAVPSVDTCGTRLYPTMKVYRRLTFGPRENLWTFYGTVRERLQRASDSA